MKTMTLPYARITQFALLILLFTGSTILAQQKTDTRTSKNNAQLKAWFEKQPDADANKDGVLTMAEARAWLKARQSNAKSRNPKPQRTNRPKPDKADVSYGTHKRHVLDFYQAKSEQPTPLVIYIHGGGFVGGTKNNMNVTMINECLKAGISCAAIHYRFVDGPLDVSACMNDGARALQFLRSKSKLWNIDAQRVACYGGSAGAGISMWLGFHEDLADPGNEDPVLRESTRITAIGTIGGQSTYDPRWISKEIGGRAWEHPSIFKMFNMSGPEDLNNPKLFKLYEEVSAITHLSKNDPPIYMYYSEADGPMPANARPGQGIHHPKFGHRLKKEMDALGIEASYRHRSEGGPNLHLEMFAFFKKHFGMP
jgi:acetyl esterase